MALNTELQRYLEMATGLTQVTKNKAETVVRGLVKQGEIAGDKAEKAVDDLLSRSERNRSAMTKLVRTETQKAVEKLGLVPKRELDEVREKVERLEQQLRGTSAKSASPSGAAKKASKAAAAKKQVAKATKKAAAKKATASSQDADTPVKKATAKKAAKAASSKKATAKKATAKKATAKKATSADATSTAAASTAESADRSAPPTAQPGDGDT